MGSIRALESRQAESVAHPKVVGKTAAEVVREIEAPAGLAADDGFAVSEVRAGNPAADSRRAPAA